MRIVVYGPVRSHRDLVLLHETILGLMLYDGCDRVIDDQEDMDMTRMATEHWLPKIRSLM